MAIGVLVFALLGYAAAFPALHWHRRDLKSFRNPLWAGYGSRDARLHGATVCYAALGWPELLMALGWRSSQTRRSLIQEREDMREARQHRADEHGAP